MERLLCNVLKKESLPMREAAALEREMVAYGSYNSDDFYIEIVDVPGTLE